MTFRLSCAAMLAAGVSSASATVIPSQPPFQPTPAYAQLPVGATSSRVALPSGSVIAVYNTGSNPSFVVLGNSSVVATASGDQVAPGGSVCLSVGSATYLAAIETAGATSINVSGGSGICAGSGGSIGGFDFLLSPTITVQNAAYSAGYSEGGTIVVTGAARTNGGSGMLNGIRIRSKGGSTNTIWVYAVSKSPAWTCTDKAAFVAADGDAANALVGFPQSVTLAVPGSWDTASYGQLTNLVANFTNKDTSPGTAIYVCLVTAGSVTPATTGDLVGVFSGLQD